MRFYRQLLTRLRPVYAHSALLFLRRYQQEQQYIEESKKSYALMPDAFAPPGYLARSRKLLDQVWQRQSDPVRTPKEVRLFAVDRGNMPFHWFQSEYRRNFDAVIFSTFNNYLGYKRGIEDLLAFSLVDADSRTPLFSMQDLPDFQEWRRRLQKDLLTAVTRAHAERPLDICFFHGSYTDFEPETLKRIRALGVPVCLWWLDEKHSFHRKPWSGYQGGHEPLIGSCDVHLTNSFDAIRWYMARGAAAYYFPQATDLENFPPINTKPDLGVTFVGGAFGYRGDFIRKLLKMGIPVECFGKGWPNGWVKDEIEIYRRSLINLGLGFTGFSPEMTCIKGRDFDIPSIGNLYLTTYDPELTYFYHIGKEIACYRNEFDCAYQIRYFIEQPEEALAIGRAGRERCRTDHSWTNRMTGLLRWMGILADV